MSKECSCSRTASVTAKCADRATVCVEGFERDGYVPEGLGIGGGDYVTFIWCLDCGLIQGFVPPSADHVSLVMAAEDEDGEGW